MKDELYDKIIKSLKNLGEYDGIQANVAMSTADGVCQITAMIMIESDKSKKGRYMRT